MIYYLFAFFGSPIILSLDFRVLGLNSHIQLNNAFLDQPFHSLVQGLWFLPNSCNLKLMNCTIISHTKIRNNKKLCQKFCVKVKTWTEETCVLCDFPIICGIWISSVVSNEMIIFKKNLIHKKQKKETWRNRVNFLWQPDVWLNQFYTLVFLVPLL